MYTLGNTTSKVVSLEESYGLNVAFVSQAILPKGALVKLDGATGEVLAASAADALGMVTVGCEAIGDKVTVQTPFSAISTGLAPAAIPLGSKVACTGYDVTTGLATYAVAVAGNMVVGTALTAGAIAGEFQVGILRTFSIL